MQTDITHETGGGGIVADLGFSPERAARKFADQQGVAGSPKSAHHRGILCLSFEQRSDPVRPPCARKAGVRRIDSK
jgi:hypothetical protein